MLKSINIKSLSLTVSALALSTSVNAAIISADWLAADDNLITQDTSTGLEWLDLTATSSRSYNDVSAKLGSGDEFDGWRYATEADVVGFFDSFGGDSNFYNGFSTQNNGLFDVIAPFWGDLYCKANTCAPGDGRSLFITGEAVNATTVSFGHIYDLSSNANTVTKDLIIITLSPPVDRFNGNASIGSALVRDIGVVPVPSAVWLFGSGLLGLFGVARRKLHS
ncbi:hypothetical protein MNBD_GAMMA05-2541 [hydrothermal vent metagenome]|uniref:Ice-binding protein C-terminal domain-containing protein n=1 Tax=hydrothermal vent metagenome TaxID=652676 RepID=A0A3B0X4X4_9ZZZZ